MGNETLKTDKCQLSSVNYQLREGYKQSEVGVIPEDWDVFEFGQLIDYTKGFAFKSKDYRADGIRIIRVSDTTFDSIKEENQIYIDEISSNQYQKWKLEEDDLILSTVGSKPPLYDSMVGKVIIIQKKYEGSLLNQNAVLIRAKKKTKFKQQILLHHFRTKKYLKYIESIFRGNANQASITLEELFRFQIPLPKLEEEQQAIASALSDVDALITALEQLIIKKRNIKQGAMQQLLTGEKRLPGFGGAWDVKTFGEIFKFLSTGSNSRSDLSDHGEVKYIHYGDIHTKWKYFLDFSKDNIPSIINDKVENLPLLKDGDLVMADASEDYDGLGISVEVKNIKNEKVVAGLHTLLLRGDKKLVADGFKGYIQSIKGVQNSLKRIATGISVYGISKSNLMPIQIHLPPLPEQQAIAQILSDMDTEIEPLEQKRDKYKAIKQGMMQELLTGKRRFA